MARRRPRLYVEEDPLIEWLAWLMDESIRIGPWSVGLDGFLGLIPGIGDMAGAAVFAFILGRAVQNGISQKAVFPMGIYIAFDLLRGAPPLLCDVVAFS